MAVTETQQIQIEFIVDTTQLDNAFTSLEKAGLIDAKLANAYRQTTAEINKQAQSIKDVSSATGPLKNNLESLLKSAKGVGDAFTEGFQEGMVDVLNKAGLSITELKQKLGLFKKESPFEKLSKDLSATQKKVLDNVAALEQLKRTGGIDTERFRKLTVELEGNRAALKRLTEEFKAVGDSAKQDTTKIDETSLSITRLKERLGLLKKESPFEKLSSDLSTTKKNILDNIAALERLKRTGGVDSEKFRVLTKELAANQAALKKLEEEYGAVTAAANKNSVVVGQNADVHESLRARLRIIVQSLAAMKLAGQGNTDAYRQLAMEAGHLQDALSDANKEIRNFGSDTRHIDNVLGSAQAIAGGFAIAQGAAALFGDESEDLQEVLLKVNSAMAILQGTQVISNALTKEGALTRLADVIATKSQIVTQKLYALVVGQSTGAMKAFRIALAATGIGLIVIALAALVANFEKIKTALSGVSDEQEDLAEATKKTADTEAEKLATLTDQDNVLKLQGKTEREILQLKIKQTEAVFEARRQQILIQEQITKTQIEAEKKNRQILAGIINFLTLPLNAVIAVINKVAQFLGKDLNLPTFGDVLAAQLFNEQETKEEAEAARKESLKQQDNLKNDLAGFHLAIKDLDKKAAADRIEEQKKAEQQARELREKELNDELAALEIRRLKVQLNSQDEIDILKKIIAKKAELELNAENLTAKQRELILASSLKNQLDLQIKFNESSTRAVLEGLISRNNAELTNLNLTNEEKLRLTIENIITTAQVETDAAQGNADKIKEINKKRDADIKAARLQSINETLDFELERTRVKNAALVRKQQRVAADPDADIKARIKAIDELKDIELKAIQARIIAITLSNKLKLISDKEYNLKYNSLVDEQTKAVEDSEAAKQAAIEETNEKGKRQAEALAQVFIDVASQIVGVLDTLFQLQSDRENQRLEEQRTRVEELRESGAITEKEAISRMKKLEIEEKKIRAAQAKRDKEIAVFQALLAIPTAYLRGLSQGNLALAIIYAALATAQFAIVASRPIPKFGKGKRKGESFEGWGEVGETGTELVQTSKGMYVAPKKTIVWLTKKDIVYNPVETQKILERSTHVVNKEVMKPIALKAGGTFDYDQMAKAISKSLSKLPGTNINIDENGFNVAIKKGIDTVNYLNKRYSSK